MSQRLLIPVTNVLILADQFIMWLDHHCEEVYWYRWGIYLPSLNSSFRLFWLLTFMPGNTQKHKLALTKNNRVEKNPRWLPIDVNTYRIEKCVFITFHDLSCYKFSILLMKSIHVYQFSINCNIVWSTRIGGNAIANSISVFPTYVEILCKMNTSRAVEWYFKNVLY